MIEIEFVPADKPGNYWPMIAGRKLRNATRQPFFDAARALLGEGVSPETEITGRHRGSETIAMRSTIGEAAKWSITERDRGGLKRIPYAAYMPDSRDTRDPSGDDVEPGGILSPETDRCPSLAPLRP